MADKKKGFFGEFKEFIMRGNVVDMAIGIVIGGAFTAIVSSFVADILNPIVGLVIGNIDFSELRAIIGTAADGSEIAVRYGVLIQKIVEFILTALVLFCIVKGMNNLKAKEAARKAAEEAAAKAAAPAPAPAEPVIPEDIKLLQEIRDLLKKN